MLFDLSSLDDDGSADPLLDTFLFCLCRDYCLEGHLFCRRRLSVYIV